MEISPLANRKQRERQVADTIPQPRPQPLNSQLEFHIIQRLHDDVDPGTVFDNDPKLSPKAQLHEHYAIPPATIEESEKCSSVIVTKRSYSKMQKNLENYIFELPKSYTGIVVEILWVFPAVVVLGKHIGWVWSLQWTFLGIAAFHIKPGGNDGETNAGKEQTIALSSHESSLKETVAGKEQMDDTNLSLAERQQQIQKQVEEDQLLEESKMMVSHLLGLVGAPPPLWPSERGKSSMDSSSAEDVANDTKKAKPNNDDNDPRNVNGKERDLSSVLPSLVHFVESQVQFLLTVDQALDYLRTSASIHLGLGPQSQCVERVEQAAMARNFRQHRLRCQNKTSEHKENDAEGSNTMANAKKCVLEPQRGSSNSILSLVSLRRNLARAMVHQSATLDGFWKHFFEHQQGHLENTDEYQPYFQEKEPSLDMPHHIVNLTWIKDARHTLSNSLSCTTEEIVDLLQTKSQQDSSTLELWKIICFWLEDATTQTRQLTHYLRGILLLPNGTIEAETSSSVRPVLQPNDPLFRNLLNFRIQLDALGAAVWSCQHYSNYSSDRNENFNIVDDNFAQQATTDDDTPNSFGVSEGSPALSRREWWEKIRQMSKICRAFENEITQMYFVPKVDSDESDGESDTAGSLHKTSQETGDYVHGDSKASARRECAARKDVPTRTVVFSGKGEVEEWSQKSGRKGKGRAGGMESDLDALALPQRDTVSELAMVSELQNRIKALIQPNEHIEAEDSDPEEETTTRIARQPSAPLFLGASGSLLSELKQSIPSGRILGTKIGSDEEEEISVGY